MSNPKTSNLQLNKLDRSSPSTTAFNTKPIIDDNMDILDVAVAAKAPLNNPAFTGSVTLPADPTLALHAATKQYVDAQVALAKTYAP